MTPGLPLEDGTHELFDRGERRSARSDEEAEVVTRHVDKDRVLVLEMAGHLRLGPERLHEAPGEVHGLVRLLVHRDVDLLVHVRSLFPLFTRPFAPPAPATTAATAVPRRPRPTVLL